MPGRTSVQRSGRGSPVTTVNCWSKARCTLANRSSSIPLPASRAADEQPGDLVEDAERLGDGAAVGVGVDQRGPAPGCRGRRPARWRPWSGRVRRRVPRRRSPAPGSVLASSADCTGGGSGAGWWSVVIASGSASRSSSGTVARTPMRLARTVPLARRRRRRPRGRRARRGGRRPRGRSPGASIATTAVSAWPDVAVASRSSTSTQRLRTTRSRRPPRRPSALVSQAAPAASSRTTFIRA